MTSPTQSWARQPFAIGLLVLWLALIGGAGYYVYDVQLMLENSTIVKGTVAAVHGSRSRTKEGTQYSYRPVYRYEVDGESYRVDAQSGSSERMSKGDEHALHVNLDDPREFLRVGYMNMYWPAAAMLTFAIPFFGLWLLGFKSPRRAKR